MENLLSLFEISPEWSPVFEDDLEAVATGRKPIAMFAPSSQSLFSSNDDESTGHADFRRWQEFCLNAELVLVQCAENVPMGKDSCCLVTLFVVRKKETWRIPALLELLDSYKAGRGWSDGAEVLRSKLLGYPEDAITAWLARERSIRVAWGVATVYFLASREQKDAVQQLGSRSISPQVVGDGLLMFKTRDELVARKEAVEICKPSVLARVGVDWTYFLSRLVGGPDACVALPTITVKPGEVSKLNNALRSRIEVWTEDGWK